jgi:superfamily II RNA helicase
VRFNLPEIPPPKLISALRSYDLLPAIVFVPSRRKCDEAATEVALDKTFQADYGKKEARLQLYEEFVRDNPEVKRHRHKRIMLRAGIASHHAGHIPSWKLLIEKMMSNGLLNAIFATSTVAAGVDFPARSVVVSMADTRGNDGWRPLFASEVQQMTGRAGRRGRDNVGFVILAPSRFQNPPKIAELLESPPDPLESKFRSTYTSLLNLLDAFGSFEQVRDIAERSFAFRNTATQITGLRRKIEKRKNLINERISESGVNIDIDTVRGFERLTSARDRLHGKTPVTREEMRIRWLRSQVKQGRIVSRGKSGKQFLLVLDSRGDNVTAMKENGQGVTFALSRIKRVYDKRYPIQDESLDDAFYDIYEDRNPIVKEPDYSFQRDDVDAAAKTIDDAIDRLLPENDAETAQTILWEFSNDAEYIQKTERDIDNLRRSIWAPFENRARVLAEFGYLDFAKEKVTESGKWLADLRLDRPLLVGEALKNGVFADLSVPAVAGFMGSLAADAERDYGELRLSNDLIQTITDFEDVIYDVGETEWECGVEAAEDINFSAAAAAEAWSSGIEWDELVMRTRTQEGDLVRLLSRTGEALMQIAHLGKSNADSAKKAREASELILREPIR